MHKIEINIKKNPQRLWKGKGDKLMKGLEKESEH